MKVKRRNLGWKKNMYKEGRRDWQPNWMAEQKLPLFLSKLSKLPFQIFLFKKYYQTMLCQDVVYLIIDSVSNMFLVIDSIPALWLLPSCKFLHDTQTVSIFICQQLVEITASGPAILMSLKKTSQSQYFSQFLNSCREGI